MARMLAYNPLLLGKLIFPTHAKVKSPPFHEEIINACMNPDNEKINIVAPRGHAKSTVTCMFYAMWHVFLEDYYFFLKGKIDPRESENNKILIASFEAFERGEIAHLPHRRRYIRFISKTETEAKKRLRSFKSALGDKTGRQDATRVFNDLFGAHGHTTAKRWDVTSTELICGTVLEAIGTGQMARGANERGLRPTLNIADDPEDENNTKTANAMEANMQWLIGNIVPSVEEGIGKSIVIGTPIKQGCMVDVLSKDTTWTNLWFTNDLSSNTLLWGWYKTEKRMKAEYDSAKQRGKLSSYYREYECKLIGDDEALFKKDTFCYWSGELKRDAMNNPYLLIKGRQVGNTFMPLPSPVESPVSISIGVDLASRVSTKSDFSVILVLGTDSRGDMYLLDMWRDRKPPSVVAQNVINFIKTYKPMFTSIETTGYQEMLREYVENHLRSENLFVAGLNMQNNPRSGKSDRLAGLEPLFFQHKFYFNADMGDSGLVVNKVLSPLEDELLIFGSGKHDDCMDALWYAQNRRTRPTHSVLHKIVQKKHRILDWMTV